MHVFRGLVAIICLIAATSILSASAHTINYDKVFIHVYSAYQAAYSELNEKIAVCSLQKSNDYNFSNIAKKIPQNLSKNQLKAALFLLKKQYEDECLNPHFASFLIKANDLKKVMDLIESEGITLSSNFNLVIIANEMEKMEALLFYTPKEFFNLLLDYETIKPEDRAVLESISELQSDYNITLLLDSLQLDNSPQIPMH